MGFQHLTPEQRKAIAKKGGTTAQASGKGYRWNEVTGREAALRVRKPEEVPADVPGK